MITIKKKILILVFFLLSACGYTPLYKGFSDINFQIELINLTGDRIISNYIRNDLFRYLKKDGSKKILFKLNINTEYDKIGITKNTAGNDTSYELKAETTIYINSEAIEDEGLKLIIVEKFNMNNMADNFKEKEYEQTIKINFANSIVNKIISRISQIQ